MTTNDGFVIIDKPAGITSHNVVAKLRKKFGTKRVGHAGTLDPMATGVLVVGINNATKFLQYITEGKKSYLATIRLGQSTTTDDREGEVIESRDWRSATDDAIRSFLVSQVGTILQKPSKVSAIKIAGERAYDLVRQGKEVDIPAREVTIHSLEVNSIVRGEFLDVEITVEGEKYEFEEEVIDEEGRKKYKNISVRFIYGKEEIEKSIKTIEDIVKKYEIKNYEEIMEIETEKKNNKERSEEESESEEEKEEEEEVFMRYIEENGIYEKEIGKKEEKKEKPKKKISARQKRIKEEIEKIYKRESETESERESETESEREREEEIKISKEEIKEEYKKIKKEIEREEEEGRIKIKKVEWKNILSYGDRTEINFEEMEEGIIMINGENGSGKSSIVDIIMYGLYETDTKNIGRGISILKDDEKGGYINIEIKKNGREYRIERKIHKNGNYIKCEIKLYENGKNITEDKIRTSNKIRSIVGEGEEVLLGNIMGQMSKMITNVDERTLTKYITEILGGKLHRKINEKVKKEERNIILNTIRNIKEEIRKTETKKNVEEEEEKIREMEEEYKELIKENVKIKIVKEEVENEREEEIREETERMKKELREIERKEEELEEIKEREEEIKKRVKRQEKMVMEIEDSEEEKEEKEEIKEEEYNKECEKCMERKGKMERLRKKNEKIEKQRIKLKEMRKQIEETKKENMNWFGGYGVYSVGVVCTDRLLC